MRTIILILTMISIAFSISPPRKGKFPAKLAKILNENPQYRKYGNPGWVKKITAIKSSENQLAKTSSTVTFKLPVLLGAFNDVAGTFSDTEFQNHLFDNPSGTMTDYYTEISYGNFNITGDVFDWIPADNDRSYYQGDGNGYGGTFPANAHGFVFEMVSKVDGTVDFSQYDNDGPDGKANSGDDDGYVDAVCVVFAQTGADWGGGSSFWPHAHSLYPNEEFETNDASENGGNIKVSSYILCPEENGSGSGNGEIRSIGVYAHEFGHVLGLPDLYDRTDDTEGPDFEDSEGLGHWCLMATGGNDALSDSPSHMSAWCKIQLGWITPTEIFEQINNLSIRQIETDAEAYILYEDPNNMSRYFLIENRQKVGFDQSLSGVGLLIYHVDENRSWGSARWSYGYVNDDEKHKLVDLEAADGKDGLDLDNNINRGDAGDPYPGITSNFSFDDSSIPSSRDYDDQSTGVAITNISNSSAIMTVDVTPRQQTGYGIKYDEYGITGNIVGSNDPVDSWAGVLFTAIDAGVLTAVDIGFLYNDLNYEVLVYDSFNGSQPGTLIGNKNGHVDALGWFTINFDDQINISAGQNFFVAVKIENQDHAFSFDKFGIIKGRSYFSGNGLNYSSLQQFGDINLRARLLTNSATSIEKPSTSPDTYVLKQNYPNPFNPETSISYQLAEAGKVDLSVFDINGRLLETLVDKWQNGGEYLIKFNADRLASGLYLYKLKTGKFSVTRKMLLVK